MLGRRCAGGCFDKVLVYYSAWENSSHVERTAVSHPEGGSWSGQLHADEGVQSGGALAGSERSSGIRIPAWIRAGALAAVALLSANACTAPRATGAKAWVARSPTASTIPGPLAMPPPASRERVVFNPSWAAFASVGGVVLSLPAAQIERVAFHQSNLDGARQLTPLDTVVDPTAEIRAPVTGKVKRAGTYVLYCRYSDDYVVVEPDGHPGWEVKILHIDGVRVKPGARVTAGQTVLAPRATPLPFQSQVDEFTAQPAWPNVHIEVIDPAIRDRPTPGPGCS